MKTCPYCSEQIQDTAIKCRYCGEWLDNRPNLGTYPVIPYFWGYEYRSKTKLFGLPLIHIAQGFDLETRRMRIATGIIAIGNIAIGGFAVGGFSMGIVAIGGMSLGLLALGGIALGGITLGGISIGVLFALGGLAISLQYAIGGLALAPHYLGGNGIDPQLLGWIRKLFPGFIY